MLTYEWKINSLTKQDNIDLGLNSVVIQVFWERKGTDSTDGVSGTYHSATAFNLNAVDPNNFVPYEELTEELVLGWIETVVNYIPPDDIPPYITQIDQQIQDQIDRIRLPIYTVGPGSFPWDESSA